MIVILLPSNRGNCSTTPISSNSCANFNKQNLTAFFKNDGPSAKEDICLQLRTLLLRTFGVLQLKLEVMVIRIRSESDFLHNHFLLLRFDFFLLLLLVVQEFLVFRDSGIQVDQPWEKFLPSPIPFQAARLMASVVSHDSKAPRCHLPHRTSATVNLVIDPVKILLAYRFPCTGSFFCE